MDPKQLADKVEGFIALDDVRLAKGLSEEQQREWLTLKADIEKTATPEAPASSRRASLRVPFDLEVTFEDARGFSRAYLRNISEGGVYVETERELKMGARFRLRVVVESEDELLDLDVEVVWVNAAPSPGSGLNRGVGVAWLSLSPEHKQTIKGIVHRALNDIANR